AKNIKEVLPQLPILILSMHAGSTMTKVSQSVGVQGFVSKSEVADVLLKAVDVLLAGGTFFPTSDSIASALKS
ncbi:MAG: hypothetical protein WBU20_16990, partial [Candidatus Acidiferrum sp.]